MRRLISITTVVINGQKTAGRIEPGTAFYVPKNAPHQFLTWTRRRTTSWS